MKRAAALRIVIDFALSRGGPEVRAAAEALRSAGKPAGGKAAPSERGIAFADWFRTTLAADARLADHWREDWARCFDAMLALDQRTEKQIAAVCQWAREHSFWRTAFLTPLKLRQRKDGTMYFDRFAEAMQAAGKTPAKRVQPRGYRNAPTAAAVAQSAADVLKTLE